MEKHETSSPMAAEVYAQVDAVADTYWRYVSRWELFDRLWRHYRTPSPAFRVLDVGCGTGALLAHLARHAENVPLGIDVFPGALAYARRRGIARLCVADAGGVPFRSSSVDLVVCQDVLEHVPDDDAALREIHRVCAPRGLALVLVPAFRFLWSARDVRLGHYRRYTLRHLAERVREAGFDIVHQTYMDLFLLPLLWGALTVARRTPAGDADLSDDALPGAEGLANRALLAWSRVEGRVAARTGLPAGVSAVVVGRRAPSAAGRTR